MDDTSLKEIGSFEKNSLEILKVRLTTYRGRRFCDIRCWMKARPAEGVVEAATGKGVTLGTNLLSELRRLIDKAMAEVELGGE